MLALFGVRLTKAAKILALKGYTLAYHNPCVVGSNPSLATIKKRPLYEVFFFMDIKTWDSNPRGREPIENAKVSLSFFLGFDTAQGSSDNPGIIFKSRLFKFERRRHNFGISFFFHFFIVNKMRHTAAQ